MAVVDKSISYSLAGMQTPTSLLQSALHELAQPLTTLSALLAEAGLLAEPISAEMLALARGECQRAVAAMHGLQALAASSGAGGTQERVLP